MRNCGFARVFTVIYPFTERFEPSDSSSAKFADFLLQHLLAREKVFLLSAVDFLLNILVKICREKALELPNYLSDLPPHRLDGGFRSGNSLFLVLVGHACKLRRPIGGQGVLVERCRQLLFEFPVSDMRLRACPDFFGAMIVNIVVFVAILLPFCPLLGGNARAALTAPEQATQGLWLVFGLLMRFTAVFEYSLYAVKEFLWNDWFVVSFINFACVEKNPRVERIGENKGNLVPLIWFFVLRFEPMFSEKRANIFKSRISFGIERKRRFKDFCLSAINSHLLGTGVVQVSEGCVEWVVATFCFFRESSFRVRAQIQDVLIGHAEFHGHHKDVIFRAVASVVGLDMLNNPSLQEPAYLPAVYRIASETIQFPTKHTLRLALFDPLHHLSEHGAIRLLGGLFLYELAHNGKPLLLCESANDGKLVFNGADLLVFNVGRFTGVEEVIHSSIIYHTITSNDTTCYDSVHEHRVS